MFSLTMEYLLLICTQLHGVDYRGTYTISLLLITSAMLPAVL